MVQNQTLIDLAHERYLRAHEAGAPDGCPRCERCGEESSILCDLGGELLCPGCMDEALRYHAIEYVDDFLAQYPEEETRFYLEWMTELLDAAEREDLRRAVAAWIRAIYESRAQIDPGGRQRLEDEKYAYCMETDGFLEFVEAQL